MESGGGAAGEDLAEVVAESVGLHYRREGIPGISRRRKGDGFVYTSPDGRTLSDPEERARIAAIAIPPAWEDVWISPDPDAHILATGRDQKGRKQYRYHPRWREVRDATKFERMVPFGHALPRLRKEIDQAMGVTGMPREKVLAGVLALLDSTLIRVGNEEYACSNDSYGLTTIRNEHAEVHGDEVQFHFRGKSGKEHEVTLRDKRLARLVRRSLDVPGFDLFAYKEGGTWRDVTSADVNAFLRELAGEDFSAKDFRTWGGTTEAARDLAVRELPTTKKQAEAAIKEAVDRAAERLGNTRAVCRSSYVHPRVFEAFPTGELAERWKAARSSGGLDRGERAVLALLEDGTEVQAVA